MSGAPTKRGGVRGESGCCAICASEVELVLLLVGRPPFRAAPFASAEPPDWCFVKRFRKLPPLLPGDLLPLPPPLCFAYICADAGCGVVSCTQQMNACDANK